eukprot:6200055-Pleurochrysis_carterae.AAC.12
MRGSTRLEKVSSVVVGQARSTSSCLASAAGKANMRATLVSARQRAAARPVGQRGERHADEEGPTGAPAPRCREEGGGQHRHAARVWHWLRSEQERDAGSAAQSPGAANGSRARVSGVFGERCKVRHPCRAASGCASGRGCALVVQRCNEANGGDRLS